MCQRCVKSVFAGVLRTLRRERKNTQKRVAYHHEKYVLGRHSDVWMRLFEKYKNEDGDLQILVNAIEYLERKLKE